MAVFHNNPILKKARGMVGGLVVFRQVRGRTIMQMRPKRPTSQSLQQKSNREQFAAASAYAREATRDPEMKKHFANEAKRMDLPNAYTAALTLKQREWKEQERLELKAQASPPEITGKPIQHSRAEQRLQVASAENNIVTIDHADDVLMHNPVQSIKSAFADLQQSVRNMNQLLTNTSTIGNDELTNVIDHSKSLSEGIDFTPHKEKILCSKAFVKNMEIKGRQERTISMQNQNNFDELRI